MISFLVLNKLLRILWGFLENHILVLVDVGGLLLDFAPNQILI